MNGWGTHTDTNRAQLANHDRFVAMRCAAAACALVAASSLVACSPPPPADPSVAVRADSGEGDGDTDSEGAEQAPAPAPVVVTAGSLEWVASEKEAIERSHTEQRPMLALFSTEWCADCKRMAKETFGDPRVKTQAGRFVALRIDATNDEDPQVSAALQKYAVINVPTLILLDSAGHEQRRFTDFIRPDTLLTEIEHVR